METNCICNEENPIRKVLCPVHGVIQYNGHSKAPENYERYYSHYHCFESSNPPCGLKGLHRCCLCEKPVPEISMASIDVEPVKKLEFEAPTDESWEESFLKEFVPGETVFDAGHNKKWFTASVPSVLAFIASLLQKERDRGLRNTGNAFAKGQEAGKSEAFSLVRKVATEMKKDTENSTNDLKANPGEWNVTRIGYNQALTDLLSTLEGK